jgi:hypothetical protein
MNPESCLTVKLLSRTVVRIYTRGEGEWQKKYQSERVFGDKNVIHILYFFCLKVLL